MATNYITISLEMYNKILEEQKELEEARRKLKEYKSKKEQRAESYKKSRKINANEKRFAEILRTSLRTFSAQV